MTKRPSPPPHPSRDPARPIVRNKRATPRQATSAVAYELAPPLPDDPLLGFVPVPHVQPRRNSITPDLQRAFIAHLAATGIVRDAARHIGRSLEALYKLRARPGAEGFRAAWDAALDRAVSRLEDSALARALNGEARAIIAGGQIIGHEVRHNEALVMFFLRNRLPMRYNPAKEIGPGHPVYEKVREAYAAEQASIRRDPERVRAIRDSIDRKVAQWRRDYIAHWDKQLAARGIDLSAFEPLPETPPAP
jgi:hypothetical protein